MSIEKSSYEEPQASTESLEKKQRERQALEQALAVLGELEQKIQDLKRDNYWANLRALQEIMYEELWAAQDRLEYGQVRHDDRDTLWFYDYQRSLNTLERYIQAHKDPKYIDEEVDVDLTEDSDLVH